MTCAVCGKPGTIPMRDDFHHRIFMYLCDACAKVINEEIQANLEDK